MSGQKTERELTGRFIGSGSVCRTVAAATQNGMERANTSRKKASGDLLDDTLGFMTRASSIGLLAPLPAAGLTRC
jgi:hypothetical protein